MRTFEAYEIKPFRLFDRGTKGGIAIEECVPDQAEFWTLFGKAKGRAEPIGDFDTRQEAEQLYRCITGWRQNTAAAG